MPPPRVEATFKICLMGEARVGKTSLIQRYVQHAFNGAYVQTIGTVVSKHIDLLNLEGGGVVKVSLLLWDVIGEKGLKELLAEAYFEGARGALAVFDVTRPVTLDDLVAWIQNVRSRDPRLPLLVLGNKSDLVEARKVTNDQAREVCSPLGVDYLPTSAKSGLNVQEAFRRVAMKALHTYTRLDLARTKGD